jgi:metal-responsive CopG/Arc/MetJ family transcriptional regulator
MRKEYDFSKGKRGAIIPAKGKTRITMYLDDEVLDEFRERAETAGVGYQTLINEALKKYIQSPTEEGKPLTLEDVRRILREELAVRSPTP